MEEKNTDLTEELQSKLDEVEINAEIEEKKLQEKKLI